MVVANMKPLLTLRRYVEKSSVTSPTAGEVRKSPGLYECPTCAQVFISSPTECSQCGGDEFTRVADFERSI